VRLFVTILAKAAAGGHSRSKFGHFGSVILAVCNRETTMRSLIVITILCFFSTPALACVFDNDCKPGHVCMDGACTGDISSGDDSDNTPTKRTGGKSCEYDDDCSHGARCIKGSGLEGVCIGGH
jgi:hypothetical protein